MGLAGNASKDETNAATPWSAVDGGKICVDRSIIQHPVLDARNKDAGCGEFPFHVQDRARREAKEGESVMDSEVETSCSGAEGDALDSPGTCSQIAHPSFGSE